MNNNKNIWRLSKKRRKNKGPNLRVSSYWETIKTFYSIDHLGKIVLSICRQEKEKHWYQLHQCIIICASRENRKKLYSWPILSSLWNNNQMQLRGTYKKLSRILIYQPVWENKKIQEVLNGQRSKSKIKYVVSTEKKQIKLEWRGERKLKPSWPVRSRY